MLFQVFFDCFEFGFEFFKCHFEYTTIYEYFLVCIFFAIFNYITYFEVLLQVFLFFLLNLLPHQAEECLYIYNLIGMD